MRKKKIPEAVTMNGSFYVEINAVRAIVKKIGRKFIEQRDADYNEYLQEMLDQGYDINIRHAKKAFKTERAGFNALISVIDAMLATAQEETATEDNRVKDKNEKERRY